VGAWYAERPAAFSGAPGPTCGLRIDPRYRGSLEAIRAQVGAMMAERHVPGLSVAVGVGGRAVYSEGFGWADLEARRPACPQTRFRVGSVSKCFTAAAMARLAQAGALDLGGPVQQYVPGFPEKGGAITPELLASHRAGIRPYRDDLEAINTRHYDSVGASLERFAADPLVARPGERFVYSNYGYVLLSAVIEGAAGRDFLTEVRESVFEPLGMRASVPDNGPGIADRASNYDTETPFSPDGSLVPSPPNDFSSKWASGGFLSTAEDLVRFGSAHLDPPVSPQGAFLRPETVGNLLRPRSGLPPLAGYALGWITARDLHLRRVSFHFGAASGGTSVLVVYPECGVVVAVVANLGHAKLPFRPVVNISKPFLPPVPPDLWMLAAVAGTAVAFRLARGRAAGRTDFPWARGMVRSCASREPARKDP
jgi:CubicO group peptidase (beta-lactamase class C family)